MRTSSASSRGFESGDRLLDSRGLIFHNNHVQDGYRTSKGCRFCSGGLEAISVLVQEELPSIDGENALDEGDRTDPTGTTAPAPDSVGTAWWDARSV
jgi:hypothetical protein